MKEFTELVRKEAEKTVADIDALEGQMHELKMKNRQTLVELNLLNNLLRFNGQKPVKIEGVKDE